MAFMIWQTTLETCKWFLFLIAAKELGRMGYRRAMASGA
jgi:hypothetical protein